MQAKALYYQSFGQGEKTLILLHSGGMAGKEWRPQIDKLSAHYRVLVPDLPGHGRSLMQKNTLTISEMAEAVLSMMDAENVAQAAICGSSMGGAVAMWLTLKHSERVSKAVFYRIGYRKNSSTYQQTRSMANPDYWQKFGLHQWLSNLHKPQGGEEAWKKVIARVSEALNPETSEHNHSLEDLATIEQPVLIITGDRDPVAPLEDALAMYKTMPNASLWVLPNATHITASNTWRSEAFAQEIRRFVG